MEIHEKYMNRCISLAQNGLGTTYPNPLVGAVIVHENKIIGEGWHLKAGEAHAEVNAIHAVADKSLLSKSTLYVNLEPCSHFGRTPPCSDLIIAHKIPHVVIGTIDPHSIVCGNGISKLRDNGVIVETGICATKCTWLNRRFFTFQNKKRPYIILKWAESKDGFIAPLQRHLTAPVWLSNKYSRQLVHKWRSEEHAILVGATTVHDDNPKLTVRDWTGNNPIRIVLDPNNRLSEENHIFDNQAKTILITNGFSKDPDTAQINFTDNVAQQICTVLYQKGVTSVIVEGGRQTIQTFIDAGLWDEARVFKSAAILGNGVLSPKFNRAFKSRQHIADDELLIFQNDDQHDNI